MKQIIILLDLPSQLALRFQKEINSTGKLKNYRHVISPSFGRKLEELKSGISVRMENVFSNGAHSVSQDQIEDIKETARRYHQQFTELTISLTDNGFYPDYWTKKDSPILLKRDAEFEVIYQIKLLYEEIGNHLTELVEKRNIQIEQQVLSENVKFRACSTRQNLLCVFRQLMERDWLRESDEIETWIDNAIAFNGQPLQPGTQPLKIQWKGTTVQLAKFLNVLVLKNSFENIGITNRKEICKWASQFIKFKGSGKSLRVELYSTNPPDNQFTIRDFSGNWSLKTDFRRGL